MAQVVVDDQSTPFDPNRKTITPSDSLVSWVVPLVREWRNVRDNAYKKRWDDWYNTLRGKWTAETKTKKRERSMLISPLSSMAVDLTVADIVEGVLGREQIIDLVDNVEDDQKEDMEKSRKQLIEDLYKDGIVKQFIDMVWNGTVYGTGIAKINIDVAREITPEVIDGRMVKTERKRVKIFPVAVEPGQFVPDPGASNIDL